MYRQIPLWLVALPILCISPYCLAQDDDPSVRGKKLSEWTRILREDKELRKRQAALLVVEALVGKSKPLVALLIKESRENTEPVIRARCVELLPRFKDQSDKISDTIIAAMRDDKSGNVRAAAALSAGKLDRTTGFPTIPQLVETLKDSDAAARAGAAESIAHFSRIESEVAKDAIPNLILCLKDSDARVRREAAFALGRMGPSAEPAVTTLAVAAAGDSSKEVRREAAKTLGGIGAKAEPAAPALTKSLQDADAEIRLQAALSLGQIGPAAAASVPDLVKAIRDADKSVRCEAIHALGRFGKAAHSAIPDLIKVLKNDEVPEVKLAAIQVLGEFGPDAKQSVDALTVASKDGRPAIREAAGEALKKIHKPPG